MGEYISPFQLYLSWSQIEFSYRNNPFFIFIHNAKSGIVGKHCRYTVCADSSIADISTYGTNITYLRSAYLIYGLSQYRNSLLYNRISGNMRKGCSCTDPDITIFFYSDAFQFLDIPDTYQRGTGHFAFSYFDQYITAS